MEHFNIPRSGLIAKNPPVNQRATLKKGRWMVVKLEASKSGSFRIGGEIESNRLGFGAMRLTGPGIWGRPTDRAEAIRTLKRVPELGINFIDTADSYGPDVSEQLIREALYPYDGILIATKGGLRRPGPGQWKPDGRPEYLRQQGIKSREKARAEADWTLAAAPHRPKSAARRAVLCGQVTAR